MVEVVEKVARRGACGFIAGRVYWKEAVALDGAARKEFLATRDAIGSSSPWRR